MNRHTPQLAIIVAVACLALVACSPAAETSSTPTLTSAASAPAEETTTPSPTPSPSPSPSPTNEAFPDSTADDSKAVAAVRAGWQAYLMAIESYYMDPSKTDMMDLSIVTTGTETSYAAQEIAQFRTEGYTTSGTNIFRDAKITEPKKNGDGVTTSTVTYCSDPSQLVTWNADGEVVEQSTIKVTVTMEQMPDKSWRAAIYETKRTEC